MDRQCRSGGAIHSSAATLPEYVAWHQHGRFFSTLGAHAGRTVSITEARKPERVSGRLVSATLFPLLGARACDQRPRLRFFQFVEKTI